MADQVQDRSDYIVPKKAAPPPRGVRPHTGVVGRYEKKQEAKRLLSASGEGSMEDALRVAAISQKAQMEGRRRQIDVRELRRIVSETGGAHQTWGS